MVFLFLPSYVISNNLFIAPHCRYKISSCPKIFACEISATTSKRSGNMYGTFSLYVADGMRYCILWRNRDIHMDMVGTQMAFQHQTLPLPSQFSYHLAKLLTYPTI